VRYTLSLFQVEKAVTLGVRVLALRMVRVVVAQDRLTVRAVKAVFSHKTVTLISGERVEAVGVVAAALTTMT
jgi:hypothetical protein